MIHDAFTPARFCSIVALVARTTFSSGALLLLALGLFAYPTGARADDDQRLFWDRSPPEALEVGHLELAVRYLGFLEDNEYRNAIADGTTLFGQRLLAKVVHRPAPFARLEAGAVLFHRFGDQRLPRLAPFLRAHLQWGGLALIFGSLEGQLTHRLIEPLFDYEQHLTRPFEEGAQLRFENERFFADLWVDWVTMIRPGDAFQEEVHVGLSTALTLLRGAHGRLELPLQGTAVHRGGTIDSSSAQLTTSLDGAVGLEGRTTLGGFVTDLHAEGYLLGYSDLSYSWVPVYARGWALYLNAALRLEHLGYIELAYFRGDGFINPMGGALFSSVSRRVNPPVVGERVRELLFLRLTNDLELGHGLFLSLRAEPYLDLRSLRPEFSTGLYLGYRQTFGLYPKP